MSRMDNETQWIVRRRPFDDRVDFLLRTETHFGKAMLFTMTPKEEGALVEPTITMPEHESQQLMNELWREGFRPRDGSGSLAHVDATKAHLEDMRKLVFKENQ